MIFLSVCHRRLSPARRAGKGPLSRDSQASLVNPTAGLFRHTASIFPAIHQGLLRQIALSGEKIPRRWAHFQFLNRAWGTPGQSPLPRRLPGAASTGVLLRPPDRQKLRPQALWQRKERNGKSGHSENAKTAPSSEGERGFGQIGSCAGTGDQVAPNQPMGTSTRAGKIAMAKHRMV